MQCTHFILSNVLCLIFSALLKWKFFEGRGLFPFPTVSPAPRTVPGRHSTSISESVTSGNLCQTLVESGIEEKAHLLKMVSFI